MCKISVIIPVYNASEYIERCARSLFEQTLDDIEYIFVNDKTPDDSIEIVRDILAEYPQRQNQTIFIELPVNSKQAVARQAGIDVAKGEYIIHCDPDDWVDQDFYCNLYECAVRGGHDLVTGDVVYHLPGDTIRVDTIADFSTTMEILQADSFFFLSLWNQLIKTDLIHSYKINFYHGVNFMEDFGFNARIYCFVKSVGHVHDVYYHYNKTNYGSITKRINSPDIVLQRIECLNNLNSFYKNQDIDVKELGLIQRSKRDVKDLFLNKRSLKKWQSLFPEVSDWVIRQNDTSLSYRIVYWLSHHIGIWPMKLYLILRDNK